jgi:hypothetical protein
MIGDLRLVIELSVAGLRQPVGRLDDVVVGAVREPPLQAILDPSMRAANHPGACAPPLLNQEGSYLRTELRATISYR